MQKDYKRIVQNINDIKNVNSELEYKIKDLLKVQKNLEDELQATKQQLSSTKADRDSYAEKFNNASTIQQKIFESKMQSTVEELKKYKDQEANRESVANAQKDARAALERDLHAAQQDAQRLRQEVANLRLEVEAGLARCDAADKRCNACQVPTAAALETSEKEIFVCAILFTVPAGQSSGRARAR